MKRVVIIGPGASGKSVLARQLGEITGLRVIELDKIFWQAGLVETPRDKWIELQQKLVGEPEWILDGDLGPYDAIEIRLGAADTIILLDFSLFRCAWRAVRRSRERVDFWLWLFKYRQKTRPFLLKAISDRAPAATLHLLSNPEAVRRFLGSIAQSYERGQLSPESMTPNPCSDF